jgi:alcohol dehydrogenase, propanol-preferring
MCIALPPAGTVTIGNEPGMFVFKNTRIIGTLVGTMQDTAASLDYAKRGMLKSICEVRPLSKFDESVQQLKRGEIAGRVVIDFNRED